MPDRKVYNQLYKNFFQSQNRMSFSGIVNNDSRLFFRSSYGVAVPQTGFGSFLQCLEVLHQSFIRYVWKPHHFFSRIRIENTSPFYWRKKFFSALLKESQSPFSEQATAHLFSQRLLLSCLGLILLTLEFLLLPSTYIPWFYSCCGSLFWPRFLNILNTEN